MSVTAGRRTPVKELNEASQRSHISFGVGTSNSLHPARVSLEFVWGHTPAAGNLISLRCACLPKFIRTSPMSGTRAAVHSYAPPPCRAQEQLFIHMHGTVLFHEQVGEGIDLPRQH